MSHDNDNDLLEEIKYDRNQSNNSSSKGSLVSLFENDRNAVFTPSSATGFIVSVMGAIVIGTLWWSGVNNRMDTFENQQDVLVETVDKMGDEYHKNLAELNNRINEMRDNLRNLSNRYDSDTKLFQTRVERDIININKSINDLTKDTNELYKKKNEMEKKVREIEFDIERLQERLNVPKRQ